MSFDFDAAVGAPFRMQPGLRRMAPAAPHLTPLEPGSRHQREKLAVLYAFAADAMCVRPGFDAAPALAALCERAAGEHPRHWQFDGRVATAPQLGVSVAGGDVERFRDGVFGLGDEISRCVSQQPAAWRLPALLALTFVEDLAIVDGGDATLPWLCVTLPSHWAPTEKVGRHFAAVHAPVADADLLRSSGGALLKLVSNGGDRWERFVWNVTDHPRLHAHPLRVPRERWALSADGAMPAAWWRTEHQTFMPLPALQQSVFTIHVDTQPLDAAIDSADSARRLHDAVASMTPAVLAYRGLTPVRDALLRWLQQRFGSGRQ